MLTSFEAIGNREGFKHFATIHIFSSKKEPIFCDTLINRHADTDTLIYVTRLAQNTVRLFASEPKIAVFEIKRERCQHTYFPKYFFGKYRLQTIAGNGRRRIDWLTAQRYE